MWKIIVVFLLYCSTKFAVSSQNQCPSTPDFSVVNASSESSITSTNVLWKIDCKVKDHVLLRANVKLKNTTELGECMWYVHLKDKNTVELGFTLTTDDDGSLIKGKSIQDEKDRFESIDTVENSKVLSLFKLGGNKKFSYENQTGFNVSFNCTWLESKCNISNNTIRCTDLNKMNSTSTNNMTEVYIVIPILVVIVLLLYLLFAKRRNKFPFSSANGSSEHTEANNLVCVQSTPETKANPIYNSNGLNEDDGETINPIYVCSGPDERQNQIYRSLDGDIDGRQDATYSVIDDKKKQTEEVNSCGAVEPTYAVVDKKKKDKKKEEKQPAEDAVDATYAVVQKKNKKHK